MRTFWLNIGVGLALAAVPVCACAHPERAVPGDANGDRRVDILDMQRVIAAVLGGGGDPRADVNGDGVVDIRDYQCLVDGANGVDAETPRVPDPPPATVDPAFLSIPRIHTAGRAGAILPVPARETASTGIRSEGRAAVVCRTSRARYALCLTPHAPPGRG